MKRSHLLLAPATPSHARIWITMPRGTDASECANRALRCFVASRELAPMPLMITSAVGGLESYCSAIAAMEGLREKLRAAGRSAEDLAGAIGAMRDARAGETALNSSKNLEDAVRHNGDALAALRRISRESAESSIVVDRAARHLNATVAALGLTHVVIVDAARIDRPSLKIYARACLLAPRDTPLVWIWTEAAMGPADPAQTFDARSDLPIHARRGILNAIKAVLVPEERDLPTDLDTAVVPPKTQIPDYGIGGATGQLANLNYDRCAQWIAALSEPDVDACRLGALLMVNLGLPEAAVDTLRHAIKRCENRALQCHMWYVTGLVWSKRRYNVAESNRCYDLAEAALDRVQTDADGDPDMECAWVQNGRAMNAILAARFAGLPVKDAFPVAFEHLQKAFELVRQGRTHDRVYLRYNLLGNMSSLMEIGGNYSVALDLLDRTFDESLAHGSKNEREWLAQQRCMRAALMARAGDFAAAVPVFREARTLMIETDRPVWAEALGRSEATARFQSGDIEGAQRVFATCLGEAVALRSRLGALTHASGLASCHVAAGRMTDAVALLRQTGEEEDVWPVERQSLDRCDLAGLRIRDTYYGLSLSIPEVDLEEMAPASISGALRGRKSEVAAARILAQ